MASRIIPADPLAYSSRQRKTNYHREVITALHGPVRNYGPCPLVAPVGPVCTGGSSVTTLLGPDLGDGQRRGTPTNATSLQPLMGLLNANSPKKWKAGHLHNAEFGGDGRARDNLTALTAAANNAHRVFEGHIKRMLLRCYQIDRANSDAPNWYGVLYTVLVSALPYANAPAVGDMHSYAYSHLTLNYRFVTLPKFPPGFPPHQGLPPPNTHNAVGFGDPQLANLQSVVLPNFAPSVNIANWLPHVNGIQFAVEIHNQP